MTDSVRTHAPMDLRLLLDEPVALVRQHLRGLLPIALVGGLAAALPNQLYVLLVGMPSFDPLSGAGLGALGGIYVVAFFAFCAQTYTQLALYLAMRHSIDGHPMSLGEALLGALRPRWLGAIALKYLIYAVSVCFCSIPILYFGMVLAPLDAILVHEDTGGTRAISRTMRLAHYNPRTGRFSGTLIRIVIAFHAIGLVMMAVGGILAMPAAVVSWLQAWRQITAGLGSMNPNDFMLPPWISLPLSLMSTVGWSVAGLYPVALFTVLYRDVRDVSEGLDLQEAVSARLAASSPVP